MTGKNRVEEDIEVEPIVSKCSRCCWSSELLPPAEASQRFKQHACAA
jgi:hypothetical protein